MSGPLPASAFTKPKALKKLSRGFTIVEVMAALGLLSFLAASGLAYSLEIFRQDSFEAQTRTVLLLFDAARAQALDNLNNSPHGVYIGPDSYTVFQGQSYQTRNISLDETVSRDPAVAALGMTEVVFSRLTGQAQVTGGQLILSDNTQRQETISVNREGMIGW